MSRESNHIALANQNHLAMICLHEAADTHPEWIVTIAFYKAVHVVQAMLSKANKSCHDHKTRHAILKRDYPEIWKHFRSLWAASTIARYLYDNANQTSYKSFVDHCPAEKVYSRFVEKRLRSVEDLSINKLSQEMKEELIRVPAS